MCSRYQQSMQLQMGVLALGELSSFFPVQLPVCGIICTILKLSGSVNIGPYGLVVLHLPT